MEEVGGVIRNFRYKQAKKYCKGKVLDVGCSEGYFLKIYKNSIGIDPDKKRIGQAQKHGKTICNDFFKHKFKHKYDTIICIETIEHLENNMDGEQSQLTINKFFNKAHKLLNNNGTLIISYPMKPPNITHPEYVKGIITHPKFKLTHKKYMPINFIVPTMDAEETSKTTNIIKPLGFIPCYLYGKIKKEQVLLVFRKIISSAQTTS